MIKTKNLLWILFALAVSTQLGILIHMIVGAESTLSHGKIVRFRCAPVDPYDSFRGRYVELSVEAFNQDSSHDETLAAIKADTHSGETIYALLDIDDSNYAFVQEYQAEAPKDSHSLWLKVRLMDSWNEIDHPLSRYYLNEEIAESAQRALNSAISRRFFMQESDSEPAPAPWIEVSIHKGRGVIRELYIEGLPLEEYLEKAASALE